jgi:complex iron-sulfur molybdoenzyme family reductase subunit beta
MNDWHTLFFRQLFKDVLKTLAAEREKKIKGQASELMDVLIARRSVDMMISPMT